MKKLSFSLMALVAVGFSATIFSQESNVVMPLETGALPGPGDRQPVWLTSFLSTAGDRLGCYFTIEYRSKDITGKEVKFETFITNDLTASSIPSLVSNLTRELKNYTVARDSHNPGVIHIIEDALQLESNYVMNKVISVQYSGNLVGCVVKDREGKNLVQGEGLVPAISEQVGGGIKDGPPSHSTSQSGDDCITVVTVNATNREVRSILTDCIPVTNYSRILWRAVMTKDASTESASLLRVQFFGTRR